MLLVCLCCDCKGGANAGIHQYHGDEHSLSNEFLLLLKTRARAILSAKLRRQIKDDDDNSNTNFTSTIAL